MPEPVTLRLWLSGPLQSWGGGSRFEVRATEMAPTKSGVIGLLCAALGRPRSESVDDLARLRFGVSFERPGQVVRDFHTAGAGTDHVMTASGAPGRGIVTERYYLEDAAFVVGLEGHDRAFATELLQAVRLPRWFLALGRRSCPPAGPLVDDRAIFEGPLEAALRDRWRPAGLPSGSYLRDEDIIGVIEDVTGATLHNDQPRGAAFKLRTFETRHVRVIPIDGAGS